LGRLIASLDMTTFPVAALLVLAATQAPSSRPAIPEPAGAAPITLGTEGRLETAVGTHSFKKLFTVSEDAIQKARLQAAAELERQAFDTQPRVVCGMTVIQADPRIDPKMIHRPAPSSPTTFHIKRIPPTACTD
jgi:hypothetical protein